MLPTPTPPTAMAAELDVVPVLVAESGGALEAGSLLGTPAAAIATTIAATISAVDVPAVLGAVVWVVALVALIGAGIARTAHRGHRHGAHADAKARTHARMLR